MGCLILFPKLATQGTLAGRGCCDGQDEVGCDDKAVTPMDKTPLDPAQLWSALMPMGHRLHR